MHYVRLTKSRKNKHAKLFDAGVLPTSEKIDHRIENCSCARTLYKSFKLTKKLPTFWVKACTVVYSVVNEGVDIALFFVGTNKFFF